MSLMIGAGDPVPLQVLLEDRDTSKFVRARVRDNTGAVLVASINVPHASDGMYFDGVSYMMPDIPNITVAYDVFDDALFTTPSQTHCPACMSFFKDTIAGAIDDLTASAATADFVAEDLSENQVAILEDDTDQAILEEQDLALVESTSKKQAVCDDETLTATEECT